MERKGGEAVKKDVEIVREDILGAWYRGSSSRKGWKGVDVRGLQLQNMNLFGWQIQYESQGVPNPLPLCLGLCLVFLSFQDENRSSISLQ